MWMTSSSAYIRQMNRRNDFINEVGLSIAVGSTNGTEKRFGCITSNRDNRYEAVVPVFVVVALTEFPAMKKQRMAMKPKSGMNPFCVNRSMTVGSSGQTPVATKACQRVYAAMRSNVNKRAVITRAVAPIIANCNRVKVVTPSKRDNLILPFVRIKGRGQMTQLLFESRTQLLNASEHNPAE